MCFCGRFADKVGEFSKELIHCITSLTLIEDMCSTALFEGSETRDRIDILAVENVNAVEAEDVL